jgi:hypothetical protein
MALLAAVPAFAPRLNFPAVMPSFVAMKRMFIWIGCGLLVLLVAGYFGATIFLGSIVTTGVNRFAPSITQTPVHLEGARLSPLSGSGTLKGLFIGNPKGWSGDKAFYIGKIHVKAEPSSIFKDCVVLSDVSIDSPEIVYETKVLSSNIGDLLKNIQGSSAEGANKDEPVGKEGKPLKFIVKHFSLTHGRVTLGIGPTALTLPMPAVTLDDVGAREGGISSSALTLAVMRSVTGSIVKATTEAAGKIGSTMGAAAGSTAKSAGEAVKSLFGGNK